MSNSSNDLREFGKFRLDAEKKILWFENQPVAASLKEIELLCVLTENSGEVVTKDEILDKIWANAFVEESNLSRHIYRLRKTLAKYGAAENLIETVPKRGYRFAGKINRGINKEVGVIETGADKQKTFGIPQISDESPTKLLPPQSPGLRFPFWVAAGLIVFSISAFFIYKQISTKSPESVKSIAVLPLRFYQSNTSDETLSIRITDAVITRLGSSDKIIVRPTNAVLSFSNDDRDILEIGRKLQTETVLDGRIQQESDKLRITLQLINVADGKQLWTGQVDGISTQILALQDEISWKILELLDSDYKRNADLTAMPTQNSDAYEAYLQGRYYSSQLNLNGLQKAIEYYKKSVELDPQFAEGWAGLASAEYNLYEHDFISKKEQVKTAKLHLEKASSLKPDLLEAYLLRGLMHMNVDWDWKNAENTYQKVIEIAPNNFSARYGYGVLLNRLGRFEEADVQLRKAVELNPVHLMTNVYIGVNFFCKKDYEAAIQQFNKVLELNPKFEPNHWWLSRALWLFGKKDEAVRQIISALEIDEKNTENKRIAEKLKTNNEISPEDFLRLLMTEWESSANKANSLTFASLNAILGEREKSLEWLEVSYKERHPWTTWIKSAPEFHSIKDEPRYRELLRRMNF